MILNLKFKSFKILFIFLIIVCVFSCKGTVENLIKDTYDSREIRVKIINNKKVVIENTRELISDDYITGEIYNFIKKSDSIIFEVNTDGSVLLNGYPFNSQLRVLQPDKKLIKMNDRLYPGYFIITALNNEIEVINIVPIETYLISVVPSEMPIYFMDEALKSQAIISRTYALYSVNRNYNEKNFDLDNTTNYQVYHGLNKAMKYGLFFKIKNAVGFTKNKILTYSGQPVVTFFHANSGGEIVSGREYFGASADKPYLVGKEDPYSKDFPGYRWTYTMSYEDFKKIFDIFEEPDVAIIEYSEKGLVSRFLIEDKVFTPKDIRWKIGLIKFKSNKFTITFDQEKRTIQFDGRGFGHGVGLSQWGAQGMALKGYDYKRILQFYYPGTEVVHIK